MKHETYKYMSHAFCCYLQCFKVIPRKIGGDFLSYVKTLNTLVDNNFLAHAKFRSFDCEVDDTLAVMIDGYKIVPKGTIYPTNDANAKGIILNDVDVSDGNNIGALMVEGYIFECQLPLPPTDAARAAMKEIKMQCIDVPPLQRLPIGIAVIGESLIPD